MSRSIPSGLLAHLQEEVTTLATCWKITRQDGAVFGFTDHDADLVVDGQTYSAASGYTRSAIQANSTLAVDNMEVVGMLDSASITVADMLAGKWDAASVQIFFVNWADLSQGKAILTSGNLGQLDAKTGQFTAELRGLSQWLQQTIGEALSPACRADLYDARCKVDRPSHTSSATVTGVTNRGIFAASGLTAANGVYSYGLVTWTSGNNNGLTKECKIYTVGSVVLSLPMPYDITVGDTFTITYGCDKSPAACRDKFNNILNFRGEPWVPGPDVLVKGPDRMQ